jgi:hypothetical protein
MPTMRYISIPGASESRPSLRKMCLLFGTSIWWPGLSGSHAAEEDINVVQSSEEEARGGASVTALAPPVLALELIDLLRTHAERFAVLPDARGLAHGRSQKRASATRLMKRLNSWVPFSSARMAVKLPIQWRKSNFRSFFSQSGSMPASSSVKSCGSSMPAAAGTPRPPRPPES